MRIEVVGETELVVSAAGRHLDIEESEEGHLGPLEMLAASLGTCTVAVLADWGLRAGLDPEGIRLTVRWEYVEDPYRVGSYDVDIEWPELPEERRVVARRVAAACTVKHTLAHPPEVRLSMAA